MARRARRYPVPWSDDLRRVVALPKRDWRKEDAAALAESWTPQLLTPAGLRQWNEFARLAPAAREAAIKEFSKKVCPIRLKPEQAMLGYDLTQVGGAFGAAPVGLGKTLFLWVAAYLASVHFGIQRPVIGVPGSLYDDTLKWHSKFARYWKAPRNGVQVLSYSQLQQPANDFLLCDCKKCRNGHPPEPGAPRPFYPDGLFLDECGFTRNNGVTTKRFRRFQKHHMHNTVTVGVDGTPMRLSPSDFWEVLKWCLKDNAPVPLSYPVKEDWVQVMDLKPRNGPRPAGALLDAFGQDYYPQHEEADAVRLGYGDRLAATPGVFLFDESSCDQPITIRVLEAPYDPQIEAAFAQFRATEKTIDGWRIGDNFGALAYGSTIGYGFYNKPTKRPPKDWLEKRNAYYQAVKNYIKHSERHGLPCDSETKARPYLKHTVVYRDWKEIEPTYKPDSIPVAISQTVLLYIAQWMRINAPALVWVKDTWVGESLSALTGVPYYNEQGKCKAGTEPVPGYNAIVSVGSNTRGRNWQAWNRNLLASVEHSAKELEQRLGRTHRYGQENPVLVDILITSSEALRALESAINEARGNKQVVKLTQKINTATWDWSHISRDARDPFSVPVEQRQARWVPWGRKVNGVET